MRSVHELDMITAPGGALEAAVQTRDEGLVRYVSISGHSNPGGADTGNVIALVVG